MTSENAVDIVELGRLGLFEVLGESYPSRDMAIDLLNRAKVPPARMPVFGEPSIALYWRTVFTRVNHGMDVPGGPLSIVRAALEDYPGNETFLKALNGKQPRVRRVLCLMSSPREAARVRLEAEYRELRAIAQASRGSLEIEQSMATRVDDIIPELLRQPVDVVHFAGHGTARGQLVFEDRAGRSAPVEIGVLSNVLSSVGQLECVVLNSCYSGGYAQELLKSASYVIGAAKPLEDACAELFVASFYRALAARKTVPEAFTVAKAGLGFRKSCAAADMRIEGR
ncbi:hypothetical protein Rhe02_89500 [Rhizocola hellebori]|uniref:CHAT domain-containing protein n=1 Tax=Rhizocola hellebori TaxID=1392758 RepID=A0A8J3QK61_9ACTN|nr:CHAT domain-containing protein [Rhizocola hellebori]GIH10883.1 hypothetical protein Rhe02_89500 [Rhizocola hellebori]